MPLAFAHTLALVQLTTVPSSLTAFPTLNKMVYDMTLVEFWVCWKLGWGGGDKDPPCVEPAGCEIYSLFTVRSMQCTESEMRLLLAIPADS